MLGWQGKSRSGRHPVGTQPWYRVRMSVWDCNTGGREGIAELGGHQNGSCWGKLSLTIWHCPDCCWLPLGEGRIFSLLTHGNHSHHYQKRQAFSYEDGVFVVRIFICMGNGLRVFSSFLREHQIAVIACCWDKVTFNPKSGHAGSKWGRVWISTSGHGTIWASI